MTGLCCVLLFGGLDFSGGNPLAAPSGRLFENACALRRARRRRPRRESWFPSRPPMTEPARCPALAALAAFAAFGALGVLMAAVTGGRMSGRRRRHGGAQARDADALRGGSRRVPSSCAALPSGRQGAPRSTSSKS
jgi:hypothetical protein